jgi:hypothetical protein
MLDVKIGNATSARSGNASCTLGAVCGTSTMSFSELMEDVPPEIGIHQAVPFRELSQEAGTDIRFDSIEVPQNRASLSPLEGVFYLASTFVQAQIEQSVSDVAKPQAAVGKECGSILIMRHLSEIAGKSASSIGEIHSLSSAGVNESVLETPSLEVPLIVPSAIVDRAAAVILVSNLEATSRVDTIALPTVEFANRDGLLSESGLKSAECGFRWNYDGVGSSERDLSSISSRVLHMLEARSLVSYTKGNADFMNVTLPDIDGVGVTLRFKENRVSSNLSIIISEQSQVVFSHADGIGLADILKESGTQSGSVEIRRGAPGTSDFVFKQTWSGDFSGEQHRRENSAYRQGGPEGSVDPTTVAEAQSYNCPVNWVFQSV